MTIPTPKYEIGDEVYLLRDATNNPFEKPVGPLKVSGIRISLTKKSSRVFYAFDYTSDYEMYGKYYREEWISKEPGAAEDASEFEKAKELAKSERGSVSVFPEQGKLGIGYGLSTPVVQSRKEYTKFWYPDKERLDNALKKLEGLNVKIQTKEDTIKNEGTELKGYALYLYK